jgi:hypothetical protein
MIQKAIKRSFSKARKKGWDKLYWLIDLHETVLKPNYKEKEISTEFYPRAKEVLQVLSIRKDIVLILFTCSWPDEIVKYIQFFAEQGINFEYINGNPEVENQGYGYYVDKPYADVLLDDKAGFDWQTDWDIIVDELAGQSLLKARTK